MTAGEKRELMARLNRDAARIAGRFGLRYRSIEAERANVKRRYGICYSDGSIKIRLRNVSTGRPLKYSSLVNTLCHELAHLRHFNHGPQFKALYLRLLEWSRQEGIYRPRARADALPQAPPAGAGRPVTPSRTGGWTPGDPRGIPPRPARAPARPRTGPAPPGDEGVQLDLF
ncbi:MAG: M48 family metallopeptidase [Myxococcota bacterium]